MSTTTVVHALTCPACASHAVEPTAPGWAHCNACSINMTIADAKTCDCQGDECVPTTAPTPEPTFEPGDEYSYALSDYARAAARSLGADWGAESGYLGAWGLIFTNDGRVSLRLFVDGDGDLVIEDRHTGAEIVVDSFHLPECAPRTPDEMREWGDVLATFVLSLGL
ncbi:hypothetical protein [Streptomyces collinus]|uniref:hypothetical protein n=1 Tax=Streptomyces collinus TaxID=42684 RepID=UPI00362794CC